MEFHFLLHLPRGDCIRSRRSLRRGGLRREVTRKSVCHRLRVRAHHVADVADKGPDVDRFRKKPHLFAFHRFELSAADLRAVGDIVKRQSGLLAQAAQQLAESRLSAGRRFLRRLFFLFFHHFSSALLRIEAASSFWRTSRIARWVRSFTWPAS